MNLLLESMKTHGSYKKEFEVMREGIQQKYNKEGKNIDVQLMVEDHDLTNIPKVDWRKFKNSMIPDPTLPKTPVKIDYLQE